MSPQPRKDTALVIGGVPRADLLPPEIKIGEKLRAQRRGLIAALVVVIVVVIGAYVAVSFLAQSKADALAAANVETTTILQQQAQYAKANTANQAIAAAQAARRTATTTEIDWKTEIADVARTLPAGATIVSLEIQSATPITPLDAPLSPIQGDRVAQFTLTVSTNDIPDTAHWIQDLSTLKGFVDATPSTIDAAKSSYQTTLVLDLNKDVYWNRFATEAAK